MFFVINIVIFMLYSRKCNKYVYLYRVDIYDIIRPSTKNFQFFPKNILSVREKGLPLHSLLRGTPLGGKDLGQ